MSNLTLDEAIIERQKVIEVQEKLYEEASTNESKEIIKSATDNDRQLVKWLTELKELRKLTVINPIIAGYNEVYEKLIKGDIEESNDKDLLKTAVNTLENVMPKYRQLSEENQNQKEQIAEYKRLLKAAVEDMYNSVNDVHCKYCSKWQTDQCQGTSHLDCYIENKFKWRYAAEALALIGEEGENDA